MAESKRKKEDVEEKRFRQESITERGSVPATTGRHAIHCLTVIGTIEGDIALYVEDHGIDDFNDIPEAVLVAAIADNTDTQTRLRVLWEYEDAELEGGGDGYTEGIDRDQAVHDDGKAVFDRYSLSVDVSASDEVAPDWREYEFTVEDIETFARTW